MVLALAFGLVIGSGSSHKITVKFRTTTQLFLALTTVALVIASAAFWQPHTTWWVLALFFFLGPLAVAT